MSKLRNLLLVAVMGSGLAAAAFAADTSGTVTVRQVVKPVGNAPTGSFTHYTATSAAQSAGSMTFDVPVPHRGTSDIIGCLSVANDVTGTIKLLRILRSGKTVTVSNNGSVATISTSDVIRTRCDWKP